MMGCSGEIGPSNGDGDGTGGGTEALAAPHVRRLTAVQYGNTVRYALGDIFTEEQLPKFEDDVSTIGFSNNPYALRVSTINIDSIYASTGTLAGLAATETPAVAQCVAATGEACFDALVEELGLKLWRRPLTAEEKADLHAMRAAVAAAPGTRAEQAEFLVQALLASPHMLYRAELGTLARNRAELTDYELASALSYSLWNFPPDDELLRVAAAGTLREPDTFAAQSRRMAQDPRWAGSLREFFVDYLKFGLLKDKTKSPTLGLTTEVREALVAGASADLEEVFLQPGATLLAPFSLNRFRANASSAPFLGLSAEGANFSPVPVAAAERHGILSHPAFLSVHSGEGESGIIKRGVYTLEQLLCVHLGNPPDNISPREDLPADFDPEKLTSREVLSIRHSSQSTCKGCHQMIDPAGFGYENYDAAGRFRLQEKGTIRIDASGTLAAGAEQLSFQDSVSFVRTLGNSRRLRECLAEKFLTYMLGEPPSEDERTAFVERFDGSAGAVSQLAGILVNTPSFKTRQPEAP